VCYPDEAGVIRGLGGAVEYEGGTVTGDRRALRPAHQGRTELEGTVFDQFSIKASVGSQVDIFEEDAPHSRLDRGAGLVCLKNKILSSSLLQKTYKNKGRKKPAYSVTFRVVVLTI
jgi:hypothetical protein